MTGAPSLFDVLEPAPAPAAGAAPDDLEPDELAHPDDARRYRCPTCAGIVSPPTRDRTTTLAAVRRIHEADCPGRNRRNRQENRP